MLWLMAILLCAEVAPPAPAPPPPAPPLSKEDAELVKELALLEKMDLVKNLELFEKDKDEEPAPPPPQAQQ
jgi:hypothetical protein